MNRESVMEEIIKMIGDIKKIDEITDVRNDWSTPLITQGIELDSLDTLNILIRIEKKFDLDVSQVSISRENFKSVSTITEFVHDLIKNKIALCP